MNSHGGSHTAPTWMGPVRQTAFVVDDIEAAAWRWVDVHGVGPWFLYEVDIPGTTYRGSTAPMKGRMGLAQTGVQQIELIEPDLAERSIYTEFLDAHGGPGFHHVCHWADLDRAKEHMVAAGSEVVQEGVTGTGNGFLYVTSLVGPPYVEFVNPTGAMASFFDAVRAASVDWDGSDPVRIR